MQESRASIDLPEVRTRFGRLVGAIFRKWRRQVDGAMKDVGLSDATRMPLLTLHTQSSPMRQKELAQALHLDTSSLVRVLAQLRERDLVTWESDPEDRRTKCIALTAQGADMAARILHISLDIEREILSDISEEELRVTRHVLEKISRRFDSL